MITETRYLFVIDTDTYAGNFARELTAWCTGQLDELGLAGKAQAEAMVATCPTMVAHFDGAVAMVPNDQGHDAPCELVATPGYWSTGRGTEYPDAQWDGVVMRWPAYQSVGIFFAERPRPDARQCLMARAQCFSWEGAAVRLLGCRLLRQARSEVLEAFYPADGEVHP